MITTPDLRTRWPRDRCRTGAPVPSPFFQFLELFYISIFDIPSFIEFQPFLPSLSHLTTSLLFLACAPSRIPTPLHHATNLGPTLFTFFLLRTSGNFLHLASLVRSAQQPTVLRPWRTMTMPAPKSGAKSDDDLPPLKAPHGPKAWISVCRATEEKKKLARPREVV